VNLTPYTDHLTRSSTVVLGLFWLSVAVIAALTIRTTAVATRLDR
jgi:hypothetical protein